ncbi:MULTISPECIES: hypothetical protein [Calothrix]|nr:MULTISPECIES: hypothetical protein [Calothrix]
MQVVSKKLVPLPRKSTVNSQQSTVNNQQSTVNSKKVNKSRLVTV